MFEIKNANVYKAQLPENYKVMESHLQELPFSPLLGTELSKDSFVANPVTGELVTPFAGGYSFTMRHDEKVIPPSAIKEAVDTRVSELERDLGKKVGRKDKALIKDAVMMELLPRAFAKTKHLNCFYLPVNSILIIDSASATLASSVVRRLVQVCGSVKTTTIHISDIKNGLATRLKRYVCNGEFDAFGSTSMTVGSEIKLSNPSTGETIQYSGIDPITSDQLENNLSDGFIVERVGFNFSNTVFFTLNSQFRIGSMSWGEIKVDDEEADSAFVWRHEASVMSHIIASIVGILCASLEYKDPEQHDQEQDGNQTAEQKEGGAK